MDYCFLSGFLVALWIQHCQCEGSSTSNQSLSVVSLQDVQALSHEPEVPPADVLPVVAPPSLKEVQQVMREASEKVEGRAAEDLLKELLEKVAEVVMGQAEEGGEGKRDEEAPHEAVREDALGVEKEYPDVKEVLEETREEKEVEGKDTGAEGGGAAAAGKEQVVAEVDAFKGPAEEGKRIAKEKGVTAAGPVEETTAGVERGGRDGAEVINKSLDTGASHEEKVAALGETGGDLTTHGAKVEGNSEQVSKEKGATETEAREAEETLAAVKMTLDKGQESVGTSGPGPAVAGVEQLGALAEETQVDEMKGEIAMPPSDRYDAEATNTAAEELVEEEKEAVVEGGVASYGEADTNVAAATGGERDADREVSEKLVDGEDGRSTEEEACVALEDSRGTKADDRAVPVMSAPVPEHGAEASVEQRLEDPAGTPGPPSGGVDAGEHPLSDEKTIHGNEIITPTDDLLPNDPAAAQPTLDNVVTDARAQHPQTGRDEAGWTNELVEDTAGNKEAGALGLDACKIGAISAAAFLIVEAAVVVFYVTRCRKKSSTSALQRACEEGCVEPEEATGGDCSDDTLPADNEQTATLDRPDVASALTHNQEQRGSWRPAAASGCTSSSTEEAGPEPDSSQDLRTSTL